MDNIQRSRTANITHRKANEVRLKLFRDNTVIGIRRCHTSSARLKKEKKETITFPPISKMSPTVISHTIRRSSWSGQGATSVQDMFFSNQISDNQRSLNRHNSVKDVSLEDCHWNVPYKKISGEANMQIKAHLKNNMYHRRVKRVSNESGPGNENQYILESTESFLLKSRQRPAVQEESASSANRDDPSSLLGALHIKSPESNRGTNTEAWTISTYGTTQPETTLQEEAQLTRNAAKTEEEVLLIENGNENDACNEFGVLEKPSGGYLNKYIDNDEEEDEFERFSDTEHKIIQGYINFPYTARKKVFMVYICGGYQDSHPERNALFEKCYPDLYINLKEKGFEFRMFDLRWGLKDGVSNDHVMASLHLKTLQECQKAGNVVFFVRLHLHFPAEIYSQKYDQVTVPATLAKETFEGIKTILETMRAAKQRITGTGTMKPNGAEEAVSTLKDGSISTESDKQLIAPDEKPTQGITEAYEAPKDPDEKDMFESTQKKISIKYDRDLTLLTQWFKLDENCVPSVYRLQAISTYYGDIFSRDPSRRQQAKSKWLGTMQRLHDILQEYSLLVLDKEAARKLLTSVTQQEIDQAFGAPGSPEDHFHCFKRVISDIKYNLSSNRASDYIDILPLKPEINKTLHEAHQELIKGIHQRVSITLICRFVFQMNYSVSHNIIAHPRA
ncbi:uncharacterized protein LOC142105195 [Mixophyes fleayi]|uniref:uncharacterized protein LOC142105195 n=1 Tax=Mixophyes fleayi TaxID=3061075 RepID=UPI003F4DB279